jgi:hypothetical protein
MNTKINDQSQRAGDEPRQRSLTTADLAASANIPPPAVQEPERPAGLVTTGGVTKTQKDDAPLAPLFAEDTAKDFRSRWDIVQRSFVDDPPAAVRSGDELVAQVIKNLAETFSGQRSKLEGELHQTDQSSTENLRLALRRYRSFFERLLSI